jgi:hypothetical protein
MGIDIPAQLEPSFISKKLLVLGQEHQHVLPTKNSEFPSSIQLLEPV